MANGLFYFNKLLTPQTLSHNSEDAFIDFPSLFNDIKLHGSSIPAQGCGTFVTTVVLPHNSPELSLMVPDCYTSYKLYVNNVLVAQNGVPAAAAAQYIPQGFNRLISLPRNTDSLKFILQVANFYHAKGGVSDDFYYRRFC